MKPSIGRPLAVVLVILGSIWLLPLLGYFLELLRIERIDMTTRAVLPAALFLMVYPVPGVIIIWRAKLYLRETRPRPPERRGFAVLPPR